MDGPSKPIKKSVLDVAKTASNIIGATAIFNAATATIIPLVGFTANGVGARLLNLLM